jgi:biofilm PGA synthesis protein PgaD
MDKSGSQHLALRYPIIDRPDLQTARQQMVYGALTFAFWVFWIYLWLPLLALAAWLFGIAEAYQYMVVLGGYHALIDLLGFYSIVIALLGGSLVVWASYNIFRFRGRPRRGGAKSVPVETIAESLGTDAASVRRWHEAQRMYVFHDENGHVARVELLAPGTPARA